MARGFDVPKTAFCQKHSWAWASMRNFKVESVDSLKSSTTMPGGRRRSLVWFERYSNVPAAC